MNGLANWNQLTRYLGFCFVFAFFVQLQLAPPQFPESGFSFKAPAELYHVLKEFGKLATGAVTFTGFVFWLFTKWGWRWPIFGKIGLINFPDLSGTWHATSYPAEWPMFTTVVSINHSFQKLEMTLLRNQSTGVTLSSSLARREPNSTRLYVIYYSSSVTGRKLREIPAVDHGDEHTGSLYLDLTASGSNPKYWSMHGQYWANKRRLKGDDSTRGTWGKLEMDFKRREPAPMAIDQMLQEDKDWLKGQFTEDEKKVSLSGI